MKFRQDLTPAQHVARREALAQVGRGGELHDAWTYMVNEVAFPIARSFSGGDRLDARAFEAAVARLRACLAGLGPPVLRETRLQPTRTKPKGDEHEFLTALRCGSSNAADQGAYELAGVRVWLSKRRMLIAFEYNGLGVTRHMLERSIERGIASWNGRLAEIENAVLDNLGLAAVWRHALVTGRTRNARMAVPCGDGLILGMMHAFPDSHPTATIAFGQSRVENPVRSPHHANVHRAVHAAGGRVDTLWRTIVDESLLGIGQIDLRDALVRFSDANAALLTQVAETALWPDAKLSSVHGGFEPEMDAAADRLAAILSLPHHREALDGREGPMSLDMPWAAGVAAPTPPPPPPPEASFTGR